MDAQRQWAGVERKHRMWFMRRRVHHEDLCLRFARVWQCGRWFPTTRERRRDCPLLLYASYLVFEEQEKSRIAVIHCGQSAE